MKLGMITSPDERGIRQAANRGLDFVEFCINVGQDTSVYTDRVDEIKALIGKHGVDVGSIGQWGTQKFDDDGKLLPEAERITKQLIDVAAALDCPNYVCGINYVKTLSYYENCSNAIEFLSDLIEYGTGKGVRISTYNCHWSNFITDKMAWTIIHGHLPELGIKYDPSHCRYAGGDYLAETSEWGDRFYHVHLKGSLIINGRRFDDPPAGLDQTDWESFLAILYAKEYTGGLSIEPHSHTWQGQLGQDGVDYTIKYFRPLLFNQDRS